MNFLSLWNGWLCHQQSFYTFMSNNKRAVSTHACNWDAPVTFGSMGMGFSNGSAGKESTCNEGETGDTGLIPGSGRSPGGRYATHSSILPWKNPWREEPGGYNPKGSQRVRHNWTTKHSTRYLYGKLFLVGGLLCCCWGVLIITSQVIKIFATTQFKILYITIISKGLSLFPPALPHAVSPVVSDSVTPWTVALQNHLSMRFSRQEYWSGVAMPSFRGSSEPRNWTHVSQVSCVGRRVLYHSRLLGSPALWSGRETFLIRAWR